jgi:RND family efflux transporter MFP subunit
MVIARPAEIGTVLTQQNQNIVSLIEVGTMKVKINVPEKDVFLMKVGDEVEVKTDMNQESYKGRIKAIVAKGDEAHTYPVEIAIQNKGSQQLKSGMFVRVNFSKIIKNEVLLIPRASLVGSVKDAKVYLVEGESVKLVPVIVGSEIGTNLEIVSGLSEGQNIVINGQLNLVDGSKIKIVK